MAASVATYKEPYKQLATATGRAELGDDPARLRALEVKLENFANDYAAWKSQAKPSAQQIFDLPLKQILHNAISVFVDILNDLHALLLRRHELSAAALRRGVVEVFTKKDRRMYVGLWVVVIAFVVYFLDASM